MNRELLARMMRATELTRGGRLADATALIQATLASAGATAGPPRRSEDRDGDIIEGECVEVAAASDVDDPAASSKGSDAAQTGVQDVLRQWTSRVEHARPPRGTPDRADAPGAFVAGLYANAAGERAYKLYVPSSVAAGESAPLIVMLHGCTQSPDDFAAGTRMNALAETQRCFVLYPAQSSSANHSRCWNWFRREDQVRDRGDIAGLSAGGAMAAVMAVAYPELYAAVGIHSGLACGSAHDLPSALAAMRGMPAVGAAEVSHATPTIVFHGDRDRTVHPRNGADVVAQSEHRQGGPGVRVSSERGQAPSGHAYTRTVHRDAAGRVLLEHWLVHGGGHTWFGGSRSGSHTDPRGPDASAELVRFFLARA